MRIVMIFFLLDCCDSGDRRAKALCGFYGPAFAESVQSWPDARVKDRPDRAYEDSYSQGPRQPRDFLHLCHYATGQEVPD
jgi:hypothetical protein